MNKSQWTATTLTALALTGFAHADRRIPGTTVSYKVQQSAGKNTGMVFFDSPSDPSGKTYLAFKCLGGGHFMMSLYSRDVLASSETSVVLMVKQGNTINKADGDVRLDRQTGKASVWETEYAEVNEGLLGTMIQAASPFTVTVMREGKNLDPVVYKFDSRGLKAGLKAVNNCY